METRVRARGGLRASREVPKVLSTLCSSSSSQSRFSRVTRWTRGVRVLLGASLFPLGCTVVALLRRWPRLRTPFRILLILLTGIMQGRDPVQCAWLVTILRFILVYHGYYRRPIHTFYLYIRITHSTRSRYLRPTSKEP